MRDLFRLIKVVAGIAFYAVTYLIKKDRAIIKKAAEYVLRTSGVDVICKGCFLRKPFIIMANHESFFDIPALLHCCDFPIIWFARKELFDIPIFGVGLRISGAIAVDRNNVRRASFAILRALKNKSKEVMVIFPQGTRLHYKRFFKGGIVVAKRKGVPVVPVRISGSRDVLKPGSWRIKPGKIEVEVFEPIDVNRYNEDEIEALVREKIYAHAVF